MTYSRKPRFDRRNASRHRLRGLLDKGNRASCGNVLSAAGGGKPLGRT